MQEVLTIPNENFSKQQELVFPYTTINKKLKLEDYSSLESFYKNYKAVNSYNNFNQATQIDFSQDKKYRTKYSYDGSGRKYKTEYLVYSLTTIGPWLPGGGIGIGIASSSSSLPNVVLPPPISVIEPYRVQSTIDYCGNIIYRDGELDKILTQEGYVDRASDGRFQYHYYLRDHQGNNRVVITQNSKVEQVNHYYPFGALFGDSQDRSGQPYKFGGKELDRMFGLDLFDFEKRGYNGVIPRFTTMDPLAEKYYSISPYVYCLNNPMRNIDMRGDSVTILNLGYGANQHMGMLVQNDAGKWNYYSFNGTKIYAKTSGSTGGGPEDNKGEKEFDTPQAFMDSDYNQKGDKENKEINGYGYAEGYILPTTPEQDKTIQETFTKIVDEGYNFFNNQCSMAVQKSLNAAGIETRRTYTTYNQGFPLKEKVNTYLPSAAFHSIKQNNPNGISIHSTKR